MKLFEYFREKRKIKLQYLKEKLKRESDFEKEKFNFELTMMKNCKHEGNWEALNVNYCTYGYSLSVVRFCKKCGYIEQRKSFVSYL